MKIYRIDPDRLRLVKVIGFNYTKEGVIEYLRSEQCSQVARDMHYPEDTVFVTIDEVGNIHHYIRTPPQEIIVREVY